MSAKWETHVQSLGGEDPLEKGVAAHSTTLAWRIPWTEVPGCTFMGSQRVATNSFTYATLQEIDQIQTKFKGQRMVEGTSLVHTQLR